MKLSVCLALCLATTDVGGRLLYANAQEVGAPAYVFLQETSEKIFREDCMVFGDLANAIDQIEELTHLLEPCVILHSPDALFFLAFTNSAMVHKPADDTHLLTDEQVKRIEYSNSAAVKAIGYGSQLAQDIIDLNNAALAASASAEEVASLKAKKKGLTDEATLACQKLKLYYTQNPTVRVDVHSSRQCRDVGVVF